MNRRLLYKPSAQRELDQMGRIEAARVMRALEAFAATGRGDVKALKGALKGRFRLRLGKCRAFFTFEPPNTIVVSDIDNRGQAY